MKMYKLISLTTLCCLSSIFVIGQTPHYQEGLSIRNREEGHYYKMMSWDDSQYQEFAYWTTSDYGAVMDFMNWRAVFPPGYDKNDNSKVYPMIIMLHGAGESGRKWTGNFDYDPSDPRYDNNDNQLYWGGQEHRDAVNKPASDSRAFPGIVIFPQVSYNGAWDGNNTVMAAGIIKYMIQQYHVDPDRVAIHGLSNGAKGVWQIAMERPDLFSAALPMSGVGNDANLDTTASLLVTTPLWMFEGGDDTNPTPAGAKQWVQAIIDKGGRPRYTEYPGLGHVIWPNAYAEPDFFSWIRAQDKRNIFVFGDSGSSGSCAIAQGSKLGISAGYLAYQWTLNGNNIVGATSRFITANTPGKYVVKFQRRVDGVWDQSFPVNVGNGTTEQATITPSSSVTLPITESGTWDKTLNLAATPGFSTYNWYRDGNLVQSGSDSILHLNDATGQDFDQADAGSYTVRIVNSGGCQGPPSKTVDVTYTNPQPTTNPPTGLTKSAVSSSSIRISWNDVSGEKYYELWRYRANTLSGSAQTPPGYPAEGYDFITFLPANSTTYTDNGLRPGAKYDYKVRAIWDQGGTFSNNTSSYTQTNLDTQSPTAPVLTGSLVGKNEIDLSWTTSTDNDVVYKYEVYDGDTKLADLRNDNDSDPTDGNPPPPTSYVMTGLTPGVTYKLRVRAEDYEGYNHAGNYSPYSNTVTIKISSGPPGVHYAYYEYGSFFPPSLKTFFDSNPHPKKTGTSPNFDLKVASRNNRYVLEFDGYIQIDNPGVYTLYTESSDGSMLYINGVDVVDNDGVHNPQIKRGSYNFSCPGRYAIRVTYFNHFSLMKTLTVKYTPGIPNENDGNPDDDGYKQANVVPNSILYQDGSDPACTTSGLAAAETASNATARIYPNPAGSDLHVVVPEDASTVQISTSWGRIVKTVNITPGDRNLVLDVSDLPSGTYILKTGTQAVRFLKQ